MTPASALAHIHPPLPTHCPVTGLPVYGHASWTYASPDGQFRLRVGFIGEQIVWLQPAGYVRLQFARKAMALLEDVLFTMQPKASSFVAIDDYSKVVGASLNARRFIVHTLRREGRLQSYVVYSPSPIFRLGLGFGRRFRLFPFEVIVARDYDEAVAIAHARITGTDGAPEEGPAIADAPNTNHLLLEEDGYDAGDDPLAPHADQLLEAVGRIFLELYGIEPVDQNVPLQHPLRPVYDALYLLRADRQAILRRHREALEDLEAQEKELTAKQTLLNETHTTLNILLDARQEERRRFEERIKNRFRTLLEPLVAGLEKTQTTARQREVIRLLHHVLRHIGTRLPHEKTTESAVFTARERLVACLLAVGESPQTVARVLGLSRRTVQNHSQRMRAKAGLRDRTTTLREWLMRGVMGSSEGPGRLS